MFSGTGITGYQGTRSRPIRKWLLPLFNPDARWWQDFLFAVADRAHQGTSGNTQSRRQGYRALTGRFGGGDLQWETMDREEGGKPFRTHYAGMLIDSYPISGNVRWLAEREGDFKQAPFQISAIEPANNSVGPLMGCFQPNKKNPQASTATTLAR